MAQFLPNTYAAGRARASDPATSHAAAARAVRFAGSHSARILAVLKECGPYTADNLAQATGLTVVQVDRRMSELRAKGLTRVSKWGDGAEMVVNGFRVWEAL